MCQKQTGHRVVTLYCQLVFIYKQAFSRVDHSVTKHGTVSYDCHKQTGHSCQKPLPV